MFLAAAVVAVALAPTPAAGPDAREVQAVVEKAAAFLKTRQSPDGSYSGKAGPGVTALVATGLLRNGHGPEDPAVAKMLTYLETKVQKDGGIYDKFLATYTTSIAVMALKEANTKGRYDAAIKNATGFLKSLQFVEGKADAKDVKYGGIGYGEKSRPDLSNQQYFLDALQAAGVGKDDPAVQRALVFVSRCQNLPSEEHNDQPFAKKAAADDKGGFVYTPVVDEKEAARIAEQGLRSAGSMTYAGLKSFLYAGVSKDDPRVQGAVKWIRSHYTLDENPGMGARGLYYYYHTFAKAMDALGQDTFEDAKGVKHDWRRELFETLKKRQRPDGSWINDQSGAFLEGNPDLATAFALLALSYCRPPEK
jgi:squalene-hopene/tetraprenyl-beta-curcumene cyclase